MYFGAEIRKKLRDNGLLGDRCVCGVSAVITGNDGYCERCFEKKLNFTNEIIGIVDLDNIYRIAGFHSTEIDTIEDFRKLMLRKEIYNLVDFHFSSYNSYNDNFIEPYDDPSFLELVNEKKAEITREVLANLKDRYLTLPNLSIFPSIVNNMEKRLNNALGEYKIQLITQLGKDSVNMSNLMNYAFSGNQVDKGKVLALTKKYKGTN